MSIEISQTNMQKERRMRKKMSKNSKAILKSITYIKQDYQKNERKKQKNMFEIMTDNNNRHQITNLGSLENTKKNKYQKI